MEVSEAIAASPRISVVMITRDRRERTIATLRHLLALPERPAILVVDNGSSDGTLAAIGTLGPRIHGIDAGANLGAAGRNIGVVRAATPYIAFSDDDSWWAAGALRRGAFLAAGGFERRFGVGGEEAVLALDLLRDGWKLRYVPAIVAHHHPSAARDPAKRRAREIRNAPWSAWLRRPLGSALSATRRAMQAAFRDRQARAGLADALRGARWVLANRDPIPGHIEHDVRRTERFA